MDWSKFYEKYKDDFPDWGFALFMVMISMLIVGGIIFGCVFVWDDQKHKQEIQRIEAETKLWEAKNR